MRTLRFAAVAAVILALAAASGCGRDTCEQLAEALCDPGPMKPCMSFVELQMTAPDDAQLTAEARQEACKLVAADDKLLALYRDRYKQSLAAANPDDGGPDPSPTPSPAAPQAPPPAPPQPAGE